MAVLEFSAVNLDDGARITEERFRNGLYHARLAGAGWPKKEKISHRTPRSVQSREKHLVNFHHFFDGRVLANDFPAQSGFKVLRI
jgi:hypothetical protein